MRRTWTAGIAALGKQIGRDICYPSARRVSKTLLIPQGHMLRWLKEAESQQVDVTEHDLLVAFIYKVSISFSWTDTMANRCPICSVLSTCPRST